MNLEKYSLGIGDRFGREGAAQLRALQQAAARGVRIAPVWNKSNREHTLIGTRPHDTLRAAEEAVRACGWSGPYHLDADHIGLGTVQAFLEPCDFFTIDVADSIGKPAAPEMAARFLTAMGKYAGPLSIPGLEAPLQVTEALLRRVADRYLFAVAEAAEVYRHIAARKDPATFITEVSLDEAAEPQSPEEMLFILAAAAREQIPLQTIAPKFTGAFLKGVEYVGDVGRFAREFTGHLAVLAFAVREFGLPASLKLSIHTGSDKFSLYPIMHRAVRQFDAGLHLKTAGTTWLEEVIGLAAAGGEGLHLAKDLYAEALRLYDELCKPYLTVISIDVRRLPRLQEVQAWGPEQFTGALRHDQSHPGYNSDFRQLLHIAFRIAAHMGPRFETMLETCRRDIEVNVTENLYQRHIVPLFLGADGQQARSSHHS